MNETVLVTCAIVALVTLALGLYLGERDRKAMREPTVNKMTTVDPHLFPQRSNVRSLPISPYTEEEYDPAWATTITHGGQSNRALLKMRKTIEQEIEERDPPQSVSAIIPYGQAAGDYPDPEATYEGMEFGPPDWRP